MDESEMVERVAEALWNAASVRAADRPRLVKWMDEAEETRDVWRHGARAAIEAMREPTEAMESAGWDSYDRNDGWSGPQYCWQAMVDAALSPSPAGEGR